MEECALGTRQKMLELFAVIETPEGAEIVIAELARMMDGLAQREKIITADQRERLLAAKEVLEPITPEFAHG
jgi:hypothetical protein